MISPNPIYIQDILADIVAKVSAEMLPILEAVCLANGYTHRVNNVEVANITGVHYMYGTGYEIIQNLNEMTKNNLNNDKYPLVCLFLDVKEEFGTTPGIYSNIPELRLAIINDTSSDFTADIRDIKNFKPILTPIYQSMLRVMATGVNGAFLYPGGDGFRHDAKRNYFWGREGVYGKEGAIFNDKLDAIEITFRNLKIYSTYCPPSVTVQN